VAFTSDAKARWARDWIGWGQYRQFWSQIAQWALRRIENADFNTDVTVEQGEGRLTVEAVDKNGEYRNFLNLQTVVVSPKGESITVRLEQTGPGHYEAKFPTKEVGSYSLNLVEMQGGKPVGFQSAATSVNYSPEFNAPEPNLNLLARLADAGAGKFLDAALPADPANNPFLHDRHRTFQPRDWWESLLKLAIALFVLDVGVRRIQIEREQWQKAWLRVRQAVIFWKGVPRPVQADESLAALLARRDQVRSTQATTTPEASPALFQPRQPVVLPIRPADSASSPPVPGTPPPEPLPSPAQGAQATTTSRLLDAKRRAQRKKD
jgi:Ca-activated chloride channel family protein